MNINIFLCVLVSLFVLLILFLGLPALFHDLNEAMTYWEDFFKQ